MKPAVLCKKFRNLEGNKSLLKPCFLLNSCKSHCELQQSCQRRSDKCECANQLLDWPFRDSFHRIVLKANSNPLQYQKLMLRIRLMVAVTPAAREREPSNCFSESNLVFITTPCTVKFAPELWSDFRCIHCLYRLDTKLTTPLSTPKRSASSKTD